MHFQEFENLKARNEEMPELKAMVEATEFAIEKDEQTEYWAKVLLLIENYLHKVELVEFSLIADTGYIMQNATRIIRGLFEISMKKNYLVTTKNCLLWCQLLNK